MNSVMSNAAEAIAAGSNSTLAFDVERIREDFPILKEPIHGQPLVYLDNAGSAQKPRQVIDAMVGMMEHGYANVHRGNHALSQAATDAYEAAREKVRRFLNAGKAQEIVFTHSATEAINLVAQSYGQKFLQAGDEVILSVTGTPRQHRALAAAARAHRHRDQGGADRRRGQLPVRRVRESCCRPRPSWSPMTHVSNALGTVLPVAEIIRASHAAGAKVLLDGAQACAAPGHRRAGPGCRFLCHRAAQDLRPDRDRRALRQAGPAERHAAVSGRRLDDPLR